MADWEQQTREGECLRYPATHSKLASLMDPQRYAIGSLCLAAPARLTSREFFACTNRQSEHMAVMKKASGCASCSDPQGLQIGSDVLLLLSGCLESLLPLKWSGCSTGGRAPLHACQLCLMSHVVCRCRYHSTMRV